MYCLDILPVDLVYSSDYYQLLNKELAVKSYIYYS